MSCVIDRWYTQTLLANQNKSAGGFPAGGTVAGSTAGNASSSATYSQSEAANHHNMMGGDLDSSEQDPTAFGYTVHNGNGANEYQ